MSFLPLYVKEIKISYFFPFHCCVLFIETNSFILIFLVPFEDRYSLLPQDVEDQFGGYVNADKQAKPDYKEQSRN
jgi:hypothetical protein